ncbi:hypothetical protein KZJ38_34375 [Paraburkholderia edwinii]|uniref:O-antigen polysaccharide polymerase Wzy-like protein n=1 Tax=Paraburkholderia edwinii TaxID=2861782 RepID=A0ABX8UXG5_9BURK|nr:hypothetical protein [Paraburkholderia edwinii]QYD72042.1 hypothetical protein KZJ38_34375 [Paraburkholderia edwinii]
MTPLQRIVARQRRARPLTTTLAGGVLCAIAFFVLYTERAHALTIVLNAMLIVAILAIRPRNQTVRWFRLFLFFFFGIFPLWQLLAGDEIYLKLYPQDSAPVVVWYLLCIFGITLTKVMLDAKSHALSERPAKPGRTAQAGPLAYLFAALSLCALAFIYIKLGGYSHIAQLYDTRLESNGTEYDPFRGLGVIQAFANTSPLWVFVCLTVRRRRNRLLTLLAFAQLGILGWLSAGIAGSRQGIVFVLVFALFVYHGFVQPISAAKARLFGFGVLLAGILLIPLKLGLGYSELGKLPERFAEQRDLDLSMGPLSAFLFRDLSRFDVQTVAINEISKPAYTLAMGRSFVGALASIIPTAVWQDKPDTFAEEKTDIVKAVERGTLEKTTLLFGMPGEFLVNFGLPGFVLSFLIPAWLLVVVNAVGNAARRWTALAAVLWPLPFLYFLFDSNVLVYYMVRWVLLFGLPIGFALKWARTERVHGSKTLRAAS